MVYRIVFLRRVFKLNKNRTLFHVRARARGWQ